MRVMTMAFFLDNNGFRLIYFVGMKRTSPYKMLYKKGSCGEKGNSSNIEPKYII